MLTPSESSVSFASYEVTFPERGKEEQEGKKYLQSANTSRAAFK
jgi:hypothetical protein